MKRITLGLLIALSLLLTPQAAQAVITFDQLTDDTFIVSHRVKLFGGRGQAVRKVYEKSASLCIAAGYSHLEIRDQESDTFQDDQSANAGVRVRFFFEDGEDRIECRELASGDYIDQATRKLDDQGYRYPSPPPAAKDSLMSSKGHGTCTTEQVATMAKVGLSAHQIEAACEES